MNESVRELNKEAMPTLRRRWISFCHKLTHLTGAMKAGNHTEAMIHKWWTRCVELRDPESTGRYSFGFHDQLRMFERLDEAGSPSKDTIEIAAWFVYFSAFTPSAECLVKDA